MRLRRFRAALLVALFAAALTGVKWDTAVDLAARQRAYDRIQPGMTIREVERLMGWPGEVEFLRVSGPPEYHAEESQKYGTPCLYRWEDAYTSVVVMFRAPAPNPPVVVQVSRMPKVKPELDGVWRWRAALCVLWLAVFFLLFLGVLTSNPVVALNSPGAPDTTNGAGSSA